MSKFHLTTNPEVEAAVKKAGIDPARSLGKTLLEKLLDFAAELDRLFSKGDSLKALSQWSYRYREDNRGETPYMGPLDTDKLGYVRIGALPTGKQKELKAFFGETAPKCRALARYVLEVDREAGVSFIERLGPKDNTKVLFKSTNHSEGLEKKLGDLADLAHRNKVSPEEHDRRHADILTNMPLTPEEEKDTARWEKDYGKESADRRRLILKTRQYVGKFLNHKLISRGRPYRCYNEGKDAYTRKDGKPITEEDIKAIEWTSPGQGSSIEGKAGDKKVIHSWFIDSSD